MDLIIPLSVIGNRSLLWRKDEIYLNLTLGNLFWVQLPFSQDRPELLSRGGAWSSQRRGRNAADDMGPGDDGDRGSTTSGSI
jgi:hypothetical protein